MEEQYYSPEEIAKRFNLKPGTVRSWINQGKLKAVKLGNLWRISEEELQRFIKAVPGEELDHWSESEIERRRQVEAGLAVVANKRKGKDTNLINWAKDKGLLVEIDRGSKWGNDDNRQGEKYRQQVCESFKLQYLESETMQAEIRELKGMVLGCWCYPKQCHGDYLAEKANNEG